MIARERANREGDSGRGPGGRRAIGLPDGLYRGEGIEKGILGAGPGSLVFCGFVVFLRFSSLSGPILWECFCRQRPG